MKAYVDIHNHVLAGLDDGPGEVAASVALVQQLCELGFTELHPTPHQMAHGWAPTDTEREQVAGELRLALAEAGCPATVCAPGGENRWDDLFLERRETRTFPTYAGGRAFLVEFVSGMVPPQLPQALFQFRLQGLLPVLAHVERYPDLCKKSERLEALEGKAALLLNLSSLGGLGGWGSKHLARSLVLERRIHAITTDAHGESDVRLSGNGLAWLEKHVGEAGLRRLLEENPRRILAGEIPDC